LKADESITPGKTLKRQLADARCIRHILTTTAINGFVTTTIMIMMMMRRMRTKMPSVMTVSP
jgi:hypothetical protein